MKDSPGSPGSGRCKRAWSAEASQRCIRGGRRSRADRMPPRRTGYRRAWGSRQPERQQSGNLLHIFHANGRTDLMNQGSTIFSQFIGFLLKHKFRQCMSRSKGIYRVWCLSFVETKTNFILKKEKESEVKARK